MARARFLLTEALREVLLRRRISPTRAAKRAGFYEDTLNACFRGVRCLSTEEIDQVLAANAIPFEEFFDYVRAAYQARQGPPDPVAIVASFRAVPHPCFADLRIWISQAPTIGSGGAPAELPAQVNEIEAIRAKDRDEALELAGIWVGTFRNRLKGASRGQAFRAEAVCDFAIALGMWGSIAACLGLTNDAAFALEHALRLYSKFPYSKGFARLLHWATFLALPAGMPESGVILAERSLVVSVVLGDTKSQASAMASLAAMKRYSGLDLEASEIASALLANPHSEPKHRFAAHQIKLNWFLLCGDLRMATAELENAKALLPGLATYETNLWKWWQGRVAGANGNFENAKTIFCELLKDSTSSLEAIDRFLIFIDLAEMLQRIQDFTTLREEAKKMQKWLPLLDLNPVRRAIILTFAQITQQRFPAEDELDEARATLKKGARGCPVAPKQDAVYVYPQGTAMSPASGSSPATVAASPSAGPSASVPVPAPESSKNDTTAATTESNHETELTPSAARTP